MTTSRLQSLRRPARGRLLAGVCAGVANAREIPVGWVRLAFIGSALLGGLGAVLYAACCLILPGDEDDADRNGPAVTVAIVCAALVGLATLCAVGAGATVFGYGWVVVALAGAVLVGFLLFDGGPAWALLPIAALTLPSVAVATAGLTLDAQTGTVVYRPLSLSSATTAAYDSGLGLMLIDLRQTALPASGTVHMRIDGGIRRTIVALPDDVCVAAEVNYKIRPYLARAAAILSDQAQPYDGVVLFGKVQPTLIGSAAAPWHAVAGPTVQIDFSSQGGSLYVRDYPARIDPQAQPDWPGYHVYPEPRPNVRGTPKRAAQRLIANWQARRQKQLANARLVDSLLPGPCGG
jgi:phage shock protein PspC (stress-responsive transcriptional regulator)